MSTDTPAPIRRGRPRSEKARDAILTAAMAELAGEVIVPGGTEPITTATVSYTHLTLPTILRV